MYLSPNSIVSKLKYLPVRIIWMAPLTKHKTPEAKLKAGREKRRRYYEKYVMFLGMSQSVPDKGLRCRDAILAQWRQSRKDKKNVRVP